MASPDADASAASRIEYRIYTRRQAQYRSRIIAFDNNIDRLIAKIETNHYHKEGYREHVAVLKDIETMYEKMLHAKQGSNLKFLEARERRVAIQAQLKKLDRERKEIPYELAAEKANREAFIGQWMQEIGTELAKKRLEKISVEEELHKAERLITLVPLDVPLEAEVEIPSKDIGRIRADDDVRIKLDPFQYQRHGTLKGKVRTVSGDAFTRKALGGEEAFFRARITLLTT